MAAILKFEVNKPETIALMFPDGKNIVNKFNVEQDVKPGVRPGRTNLTPSRGVRLREFTW